MVSVDLIEKMQEDIKKSIKHLNNGGCIHFAYYFCEALKKHNIPYQVFLSSWEPIDITYKYFESTSHVMVYLSDIGYIDGYDLYPTKQSYNVWYDDERYTRQVYLSIRKLNAFRGRKYCWNPTYPTEQNRKLMTIINRHVTKWQKKKST